MDKVIYITEKIPCGTEQAFKMFTINNKIKLWLCTTAEIEPRTGGKYELYWDPKDRENNSTKGCSITAFDRNKLLSFEWKGPVQYKDFMNSADPLTHVSIFFLPLSDHSTKNQSTEIHLLHTGWRSSDQWEDARLWFKKAWDTSFEKLKEITSV